MCPWLENHQKWLYLGFHRQGHIWVWNYVKITFFSEWNYIFNLHTISVWNEKSIKHSFDGSLIVSSGVQFFKHTEEIMGKFCCQPLYTAHAHTSPHTPETENLTRFTLTHILWDTRPPSYTQTHSQFSFRNTSEELHSVELSASRLNKTSHSWTN